jgi:hypothetical protein
MTFFPGISLFSRLVDKPGSLLSSADADGYARLARDLARDDRQRRDRQWLAALDTLELATLRRPLGRGAPSPQRSARARG